MGYLSCNADSAIAVSTPSTPPPPSTAAAAASSNNKQQKPIKIQQFHYSDLEAATNGFSDQKLLGRGSHGCVYKAVLRGRRVVAVKKPSKRLQHQNQQQEVDNELEILSKIHSPGLVNLLGFANNESKDRLLVVEFMSNGTLYDVLHSDSSGRVLNWGRRIRMALQIAKAVDTLHSHNPPIIHRDIKSANVLIDRNSNARLGDFGLAIRCGVDDDCRLRSTPPAGTMGYLDPCYVTPDNLSTKTDVFSFGILLLEIISGRKAIDVDHSPASIVDWAIPLVKRGKLGLIYDPRIPLLKDPLIKRQLVLIASKCVRSCRERRPSMKEVVDWLSTLSKLVPLHSWNGFNNPCMMVETMGRPVEFGSRRAEVEEEEEEGGKLGRRTVKDSRRVFSDLGTRSSLIDLMAGGADRSDSMRPPSSRFSRSIFGSARYVAGGARRTTQSKTVMSSSISNDNIADSCLRRNNSVGDGSELVSETKEKPPRSRFGAERSEDI
ncbi:Serine/threonine-protein kinase-like protein At3g51990 [Linum grandiflorum]